jgi:DNA-binding transcriptional LysR family regulator
MDEVARVERRVSLRDLRVLMSVVQTGSMGKTARVLATSQPAVSRSISDLEHALGVRLLDRTAQGVEPTLYGRALLKRGVAVFDELSQGLKDIRFLADPTDGDLAVAASIAIAEGLLCSVIGRLRRRHPRFTFQVHATDTATAYRALLERTVDLAVVHIVEPPDADLMNVQTLLHDPHVVVAGAHNPLTRRRRISLQELAAGPWVLPIRNQPYGAIVSEAFRAHGLQVPPALVSSTLPLRTALLMTGPYLSMVPRIVVHFPPKDRLLRALPIELPTTVRPLALVTLKNRTLNPLVHLFADQVRDAARPLASKK